MEFPGKKQPLKRKAGEGASFLAEAKHKHQALFVQYLDHAEDYENLDQFLGDLQPAAWQLTEQIAKASWKNGLIKGEQKRT